MIALIAAVARNGVIGRGGKIPWHIPEDLKRFKQLTMGHVLVMGRKTYESIGRPLPGRETIVLTREERATFALDDASPVSFDTFDLVLAAYERYKARLNSKIWFICGGAEVYREALERDIVDRMYLTNIYADFEGDTFMPQIPNVPGPAKWRETSSEPHLNAPVPYIFATLERNR